MARSSRYMTCFSRTLDSRFLGATLACILILLPLQILAQTTPAPIDSCSPNPCKNGGICTDNGDTVHCDCVSGWTGPYCEDEDLCASDPCQNGGVCENIIASSSYTCDCPPNHSGTHCEDVLQACILPVPSPFPADGVTCDTVPHGETIADYCSCQPGYSIMDDTITCNDQVFEPTAPQCTDIIECDASPCDANAACVNDIGSFACICNTGYAGDGFTCTDIDECMDDPNPCGTDEVITCENEEPGYTCSCPEGYTLSNLICCEDYMPFGTEAGDTILTSDYTRTSVLQTENLAPITGIPISADVLSETVVVTSTGTIVLSDEVDVASLENPTPDTGSLKSASAFGVGTLFCKETSKLNYQVYDDPVADEATLNAVKDRLNTLTTPDPTNPSTITDYGLENLKENLNWALIVTWEDVVRPGADCTSDEKNTYQAILTTDGRNLAMMVFFKCNFMNWNGDVQPVDPLIGSVLEYIDFPIRTEAYRPDTLDGNTGHRGQYVFRLDTNLDTYVNPRSWCLSWYNDPASIINVNGRLRNRCPCALRQVIFHPTFQRCDLPLPPDINTEGAVYPDPIPDCYESIRGQPGRSGVRCMYNEPSGFGATIIEGYRDFIESSVVQSIIPRQGDTGDQELLYDQDHLPEWYCAKLSNNEEFRNLFLERRPAASCRDFRGSRRGWNQGDPHFQTLDGANFTFNGHGEYWLTTFTNVDYQIQVRTAVAQNENGVEVDTGTVNSAFAVFFGESRVEIRLNSARDAMEVLVNRTLVPSSEYESGVYQSDVIELLLMMNPPEYSAINRTEIAVSFEVEEAIYITLTTSIGFRSLDFILDAPEDYSSLGQTTGLLGIWDGNTANDLTPAGGAPGSELPLDSPDEDIYNNFGETWRTTAVTSFFTYEGAETWDDFNNPSFPVKFLDDLEDQATPALLALADAECESNLQCRFDVLATGVGAAGKATLTFENDIMNDIEAVENFPPNITSVVQTSGMAALQDGSDDLHADILQLEVGGTYVFQVSASDPNGDTVTFSLNPPVSVGASIDADTGVLTWNPPNTDISTLEVLASDGILSTGVFYRVKICDCNNGGTCDFESFAVNQDFTFNNYAIVQCICTPGYSGYDCTQNYDACADNPCFPGVLCIDEDPPSDSHQCGPCPSTLVGNGTNCVDEDECETNNHDCTQICNNKVEGYYCTCEEGYTLHIDQKTCEDIDECATQIHDCGSNSICTNTIGSYTCECDLGFLNTTVDGSITCTDVDECVEPSDDCDLNARCQNTEGSYSCECLTGYHGLGRTGDCFDINECEDPTLNDCSGVATCNNEPGYYTCSCLDGYTGNGYNCSDVDECLEGTDTCDTTSSTCMNMEGGFRCDCLDGFRGDGMECYDTDECTEGTHNCTAGSMCENTAGSFDCPCLAGYVASTSGDTCEDIDECDSTTPTHDCNTNADCTNSNGSFTCQCHSGFQGDGVTCEDVDECALLLDDCVQECDNTEGSYTCSCNPGFTLELDGTCTVAADCGVSNPCGDYTLCAMDGLTEVCYCNQTGLDLLSSNNCEDIDECDPTVEQVCESNCTNTFGSFICSCYDGYELDANGRNCTDIDECLEANACGTNAICNNGEGNYTCECVDGYVGDAYVAGCTDINECTDPSPCPLNANCTNTDGAYTCACEEGYSGNPYMMCTDIDECLASSPCDTNANCNNTIGSYTCSCLTGWSGDGVTCSDIDECAAETDNCGNNTECTDVDGSFSCRCLDGFSGDPVVGCRNIDECTEQPNICHFGAECTDTEGSYNCSCMTPGYTGNDTYCRDVNECDEVTSFCNNVTEECVNTIGSALCNCKTGYFMNGAVCEDFDECATNTHTCGDMMTCENTPGSYSCVCAPGYVEVIDTTCEDIDECAADSHNCAVTEVCVNLVGSFRCDCGENTYGPTCQASTTLYLNFLLQYVKGVSVEAEPNRIFDAAHHDILADDIQALLNAADIYVVSFLNATIDSTDNLADTWWRIDVALGSISQTDLEEAFYGGLSGANENIILPDSALPVPDVDECLDPTICVDGTCENTDGSYTCTCDAGYTLIAQSCTNIDECLTIQECDQNCTDTQGSYECSCNAGYTLNADDKNCDDIDECVSSTHDCEQLCVNTPPGSFSCDCESTHTLNPDGKTCTLIPVPTDPPMVGCDEITCEDNEECLDTPTELPGYSCICIIDYGRVPTDSAACRPISVLELVLTVIQLDGEDIVFEDDLYDETSDLYIDYESMFCTAMKNYFLGRRGHSLEAVISNDVRCRATRFEPGSVVGYLEFTVAGSTADEADYNAQLLSDLPLDEETSVQASTFVVTLSSLTITEPETTCTDTQRLQSFDGAPATCKEYRTLGANATILQINAVPTPLTEDQANLGSPEFADLEDSFCRAIVSHLYAKSVTEDSLMCLITSLADGSELNTIDVILKFDVFADTQAEVADLVSVIMEADFNVINTVTDTEDDIVYTLGSFQTLDPTACDSSPCLNGGACIATGDTYECQCAPGYSGTNCDNSGLSTGVIIGIVLGVVCAVLVLIVLCMCCVFFSTQARRDRQKALFARSVYGRRGSRARAGGDWDTWSQDSEDSSLRQRSVIMNQAIARIGQDGAGPSFIRPDYDRPGPSRPSHGPGSYGGFVAPYVVDGSEAGTQRHSGHRSDEGRSRRSGFSDSHSTILRNPIHPTIEARWPGQLDERERDNYLDNEFLYY